MTQRRSPRESDSTDVDSPSNLVFAPPKGDVTTAFGTSQVTYEPGRIIYNNHRLGGSRVANIGLDTDQVPFGTGRSETDISALGVTGETSLRTSFYVTSPRVRYPLFGGFAFFSAPPETVDLSVTIGVKNLYTPPFPFTASTIRSFATTTTRTIYRETSITATGTINVPTSNYGALTLVVDDVGGRKPKGLYRDPDRYPELELIDVPQFYADTDAYAYIQVRRTDGEEMPTFAYSSATLQMGQPFTIEATDIIEY